MWSAIHSSYVRRLKDLPIQGRAAKLTVHVGRWRCRNRGCVRRIKRWAQSRPPSGPIPVVGVDEWAWRKRQSYGTILVDLEKGVVADLLPDRSAASFKKRLQEHPGVTMVSRDRDGVYAEGGYSGAPRAQQVADRFHLVQNLIRAVEDELAHQRPRY